MRLRRFSSGVWLLFRAHLVAALTLGICLRLAMRLVALSVPQPTVFTPGGTTLILMIAVVMSAPVSLVFFLLRRAVGGTPLRRGLVFGLGFVLVAGVFVYPEAATLGRVWLNLPLFTAILVLYGVVFSLTVARLERRGERRRAAKVRPATERPAPVPVQPVP